MSTESNSKKEQRKLWSAKLPLSTLGTMKKLVEDGHVESATDAVVQGIASLAERLLGTPAPKPTEPLPRKIASVADAQHIAAKLAPKAAEPVYTEQPKPTTPVYTVPPSDNLLLRRLNSSVLKPDERFSAPRQQHQTKP